MFSSVVILFAMLARCIYRCKTATTERNITTYIIKSSEIPTKVFAWCHLSGVFSTRLFSSS